MAEKKQTQSKVPATTNHNGSRGKKQVPTEKAKKYEQLEIQEKKEKQKIPVRIITSMVFGVLFLLFLITWMEDPGTNESTWFFRGLYNVVRGLFGEAAFYMAIPGFLLMFYIHAFSGKKPILMRSICLGVFMLCFGCIAHWWGIYYFQHDYVLGTGFQWVKDIFRGGVNGTTGGLICGGLTELMLWIFNEILTLIILVFAGLLTLMATFNITIPSIARAIQNRPRAQWEEEKQSRFIESLILEQGMDDAIIRAKTYLDAGVDGIMIHSKKKDPDEVLEFCTKFREKCEDVPIVVVPTTYNHITEKELGEAGVNIIIHANHLIRSAFPAMNKVAHTILENERSYEVDEVCMPIKEILTLI